MHCNLFLHNCDWFAKTWRVWKIWRGFFYFIPHLLWQIDENVWVFFLMWHCWSLARLGIGNVHSMCSLSCSWQCPVLGSTGDVFSFRQVSAWQFALHGCTDVVLNCTGVLSCGFSSHEVLSPSGLPGLAHFHLSNVPSCEVLLLFHHSSSLHLFMWVAALFSRCCLCLEQQCFPQALTILSLISLKWWHFLLFS